MIPKRYTPCNIGRTINKPILLGKVGEQNALRIEFGCEEWLTDYPNATIELYVKRPDNDGYHPALGEEGYDRIWIIDERAVLTAGNGVIELILKDAETGTKIKSATGYTTVESSPSASGDPSDLGFVTYSRAQNLTEAQKRQARNNIGAGTGTGTGTGGGDGFSPTIEVQAIEGGHRFIITDIDGEKVVDVMDGKDGKAGEPGEDGRGIDSVVRTSGNGSAGSTDVYTITYTDNTTSNLTVYNGKDGVDGEPGANGVSPTVAVQTIDGGHRVTITSAAETQSFDVMNGTDGAPGAPGSPGEKGDAGRGIVSIERTSGDGSAGTVDTYTITYTDGTTSTYQVRNGADGKDGSNAEGGGTSVELDTTLTQGGQAADAAVVGEKLNELNEANEEQDARLTALENTSGIAVRPLKTENMGELFEQPETYLAWFQGCLKYDPDVGCPVGVISGKDAHTTGSGKAYFIKIDPKTGEVTKTVAGQYDDDDTYGCFTQSFYIDNDGVYTFYAGINEPSGWSEIEQRKYTSTDKGVTWTYTDVSGQTFPGGSIIKLKSGRLIGLTTNGSNVRGQAIYSDNDGETWTKGYTFSACTEVEIIELKNSLIAIGRKNLTITDPLPAVLYYSTDDGLTWTGGADSTTLTDMCNPCSGVYWEKEELLELFYCSRYTNGNTGTVYHAYAKLEDALADKFTVEAIGESKQESAGIDFGYCATACDQDESAWVIYYDKADSGNGTNLNLILANKTCVTLPVVKADGSLISLYSAKIVDKKLSALRSELITKINEAILGGGGSGGEDSGGEDSGGDSGGSGGDALDGTTYVTDGLYSYYDFQDDSRYDASTSNWSPVIGSNKAFVVTAYNDMTGVGDAKEESKSGMYFAGTPGFTGDATIEFSLNKAVENNGHKLFATSSAIDFYNGAVTTMTKVAISGNVAAAFWTQGKTAQNDHIVLTYSASDNALVFYRNGQVDSQGTLTGALMYEYITSQDISHAFLRVYSRVLSAEEITNNYTFAKNRLGLN